MRRTGLILLLLILIILMLVAVKYPRGRLDWPYDRSTSFRIFFSAILFILILYLIYLVNLYVEYPSSSTMFRIIVGIVLAFFIAAGVLFPESLKIAPHE
ncbi:MAG: hypothetical protein J7L88_05755 [Thermoplasmata archaeon]|nr:hypothetical protein [Thermoplasmata archaeon]